VSYGVYRRPNQSGKGVLIGLLSVSEVARSLGVSDKTVWRLIDAGDLPFVRIRARILVRASDLDEFVEGRLERRPKAAQRDLFLE